MILGNRHTQIGLKMHSKFQNVKTKLHLKCVTLLIHPGNFNEMKRFCEYETYYKVFILLSP